LESRLFKNFFSSSSSSVLLLCIKHNTLIIIMLKRRRGQNASINPALEEIEVDENTLRASLTCELCEKVLRDANTVVRSLILLLLLLLLNVVDDDEEEEVLSFSLLLSFSLSISSSSFSLRAQNASTMIYACNIYSLSLVTS
jgi:hypothetical protein